MSIFIYDKWEKEINKKINKERIKNIYSDFKSNRLNFNNMPYGSFKKYNYIIDNITVINYILVVSMQCAGETDFANFINYNRQKSKSSIINNFLDGCFEEVLEVLEVLSGEQNIEK